jgi:hypothetical protein
LNLVERATHTMNDGEVETQRRERKVELIAHALAHLRRSLDALPTRIVGARGSHERRHIGATLRDQLRAALAQRLGGDERWDHIRDLAEEFVAAWYVEHAGGPRIPGAVKFLAVGVTGAVGGAAAAAALDPQIRAGASKLKDRLLSLAAELARRMASPPPQAPSAPAPTSDTATTAASSGPAESEVGIWPQSLGSSPGLVGSISPLFGRGRRGWVPGPRRRG